MRVIGFAFQKGKFRIAVLETHGAGIAYYSHRAVKVDPGLQIPALMNRYMLDFRSCLEEFRPEILSVKQVFESTTLDSATFHILPVGLLGLLASEQNKTFHRYTIQALRHPSSFQLPKGKKPIDEVDTQFGEHPPYWDKPQRESVLVAWRAFLEEA